MSTTTTTTQVDVRGPRFAAWITTAVIVATLLASVAAFSIPARRVSRRPTTKATPNAAISTTMTRTQEELMTV